MFEWIDVTMLGLLVGLFGFNFGKSSSESKQESGLRGTEYFNDAAGRAASALADTKNLQSEINAADFGSFRGQRGEDMFNPGQFGLGGTGKFNLLAGHFRSPARCVFPATPH